MIGGHAVVAARHAHTLPSPRPDRLAADVWYRCVCYLPLESVVAPSMTCVTFNTAVARSMQQCSVYMCSTYMMHVLLMLCGLERCASVSFFPGAHRASDVGICVDKQFDCGAHFCWQTAAHLFILLDERRTVFGVCLRSPLDGACLRSPVDDVCAYAALLMACAYAALLMACAGVFLTP